jgi:hypothetical protein
MPGAGALLYSSGSGIKGFVKEGASSPASLVKKGLMMVLSMEGEPFKMLSTIQHRLRRWSPSTRPCQLPLYRRTDSAALVDPEVIAPAFVIWRSIASDGVTRQRPDAYQISQSMGGDDQIATQGNSRSDARFRC